MLWPECPHLDGRVHVYFRTLDGLASLSPSETDQLKDYVDVETLPDGSQRVDCEAIALLRQLQDSMIPRRFMARLASRDTLH